MSRDEGQLSYLLSGGKSVQVFCSRCRSSRTLDLPALIAKVGPDYSLWNRRCRCRMLRGCPGWNSFRAGPPFFAKLCDAHTEARWMLDDGPRQAAACAMHAPSR